MNNLCNVIFYVENVAQTIAFYEKAFGLSRSFIDETGNYGQLETGRTALGFASFELGKMNLGAAFRPYTKSAPVAGMEIAISSTTLAETIAQAIAAGAELITPAEKKPWGQTVAYMRDPNGILIEICTPMAAACHAADEIDSCCH